MRRAFLTLMTVLLMSVGAGAETEPTVPAQGPVASQGRLTAAVLGVHDETLYLRGQQGLVIPVEVTRDTQLDGEPVGSFSRVGTHLRKHYPAGSSLEIVFEVRHGGDGEIQNVATSITRR